MTYLYFALFGVCLAMLIAGVVLNRRRRLASTRFRKGMWATASGINLLLAVGSAAVGGYMTWLAHRGQPEPTERALFRGVDYSRQVTRSPRPMVIHVVTLHLKAPGVRFLVTPPDPVNDHPIRAQKTSAFLKKSGVQLAINGNYFFPFRSNSPFDYFPHAGDGVDLCGMAASRGEVYSNREWVEGTLYISEANEVSFDAPIGPIYNAIAGNGFLVRNGAISTTVPASEPYPRAAIGLTKDRERLLLFIIDGKQPGYSEGATLSELAKIMLEAGAHDGVRLDEGGSCALAVEDGPGKVKLLNVQVNHRIPFNERVVANHLGVFAERLE